MWPLISSLRISSAWAAASSGVSANLTPPAFIRPPVRTWDLITVGPPISSATLRASSAVVQNPYLVTGIPASSTILRASYSKNLISGAEPYPNSAFDEGCSVFISKVKPALYLRADLLYEREQQPIPLQSAGSHRRVARSRRGGADSPRAG